MMFAPEWDAFWMDSHAVTASCNVRSGLPVTRTIRLDARASTAGAGRPVSSRATSVGRFPFASSQCK